MPFRIRYSVGDPTEAHHLPRQGGVFRADLPNVRKSEHFLLADAVSNPLKTRKTRSQGRVFQIDVYEIANREIFMRAVDAVG
jgi:hypothetical protein